MNRWSLFYAFRDAREGTARNPLASLATIIMAAMAMLLLAGMTWLNSGIQGAAGLLEQQSKIRVFLHEGVDAAAIAAAVAAVPGVRDVEVIPKETTFANMQAVFSGQVDLAEVFAENPFPDSLSIRVADPGTIGTVAGRIEGIDGVEQVIYGQAYVERLLAMSRALRQVGSIGIGAFILVALLITTLTLQLALLARRDEIRIRRLMGVSRGGVYGQFLLEGGLLGVTGGVVAAIVLTYGLRYLLQRFLAVLPLGTVVPDLLPAVVLAVAGGLVMGLVGSFLATLRVLTREEASGP